MGVLLPGNRPYLSDESRILHPASSDKCRIWSGQGHCSIGSCLLEPLTCWWQQTEHLLLCWVKKHYWRFECFSLILSLMIKTQLTQTWFSWKFPLKLLSSSFNALVLCVGYWQEYISCNQKVGHMLTIRKWKQPFSWFSEKLECRSQWQWRMEKSISWSFNDLGRI